MAEILTLLLLFLVTCLTTTYVVAAPRAYSLSDHMPDVVKSMSAKGYMDIAHMLAGDFPGFAPHIVLPEFCETQACTVFAPDDVAVLVGPNPFTQHSTSYPPLPLMYYHIVPGVVTKEMLESPSMYETKLTTLLRGHPLVVTTGHPYSGTDLPSLNFIQVEEWDVYNDGHLIVHGLNDFLDPQRQERLYPWFSNQPEALPPTAPAKTTTTIAEPPMTKKVGEAVDSNNSIRIHHTLLSLLLAFIVLVTILFV